MAGHPDCVLHIAWEDCSLNSHYALDEMTLCYIILGMHVVFYAQSLT